MNEYDKDNSIIDYSQTYIDYDSLDGYEFERFCARVLMANGYKDVQLTKASGDNGVDIITEKDEIRFAIQCKCYSSKVGNHAVQEVYSGKDFYKCDKAVVLTNNYFTPSAINTANKLGVILWDRNDLNLMLHTMNPKIYKKSRINNSNKRNVFNSCSNRLIVMLFIIVILASISNKKSESYIKNKEGTDINVQLLQTSSVIDKEKYNKVIMLGANSTSHFVSSSGKEYSVDNTFDGDIYTCWQDGEEGDAIGNILEYSFNTCRIKEIEIINGNRMRSNSFNENNRLSKVTLVFYLDDVEVSRQIMRFIDNQEESESVSLESSIECNKIAIVIDEVYNGSKYSDTGISEVMFYSE